MKKLSSKLTMFVVVVLIFSLTGCAPKGDPSQVINSYYQNIKDGNIEGAYGTLSEQSKKDFTKEDFAKWQETSKEVNSLKNFKVEKSNEYKEKDLDGIKFKNVIEFNVTETTQDLYENKENTINYKRNVVNDNGVWKVYRKKENGKELVASALNSLAWMYMDGKGKKQDPNQAVTILNDALKNNPNFVYTYYTLGVAYSRLGRYDESISVINTYLTKETKNENKSSGYNVLGVAYEGKGQFDKAKECLNEAIKLNPNNEYAKTNLERVKQY